MAATPAYEDSVFINCPFDPAYFPLFEVIVFTVFTCGFVARCAKEESDSGDVRVDKLARLIAGCRYGIHDISRIGLESDSGLPRFNMPFELGLDLGCKKFGEPRHRQKRLLILDTKPHRYQAFLSDIAGQDIRAHGDRPDDVITIVRDWLRTSSTRERVPGELIVRNQYQAFVKKLPELCAELGVDRANLNYLDYAAFIGNWLKGAEATAAAAARNHPAR